MNPDGLEAKSTSFPEWAAILALGLVLLGWGLVLVKDRLVEWWAVFATIVR